MLSPDTSNRIYRRRSHATARNRASAARNTRESGANHGRGSPRLGAVVTPALGVGKVERDVGAALGRPEDVVDLADGVEQRLAVCGVLLVLALRGELDRLPELVVQVRVLFEVFGLEVIVPEDVEFALNDLGLLLLDVDVANAVVDALRVLGVTKRRDLLFHGEYGFCGDAGRSRVVDAARTVAVCERDVLRAEQITEQVHRIGNSLQCWPRWAVDASRSITHETASHQGASFLASQALDSVERFRN